MVKVICCYPKISGDIAIDRVPTNLESQGKPGEKNGQGKSGNFFYFSKNLGNFLQMLIVMIIKIHDFHLKNVAIIISCSR